MKTSKSRVLLGLLMIVVGIGTFLYPVIKQAYTSKRQSELKEAFQELLIANQTQSEATITPSDSNANITQKERITITPLVVPEDIILEVVDDTKDTQTPNNVKNRLNGQTLVGLIEIEKIDLIYAIVEGTNEWNLGVAIGHMTKTAAIGENGNCVIAGHRGGTSGPYFKYINKLTTGDEIKVTDIDGNEFIYYVTDSFVVEPTEVWVAENISDKKILTLITCQKSGTKRLIVRARCDE